MSNLSWPWHWVCRPLGIRVRLVAPHRFENLVSAFGIPFVPLAGDPEIISQALNEAGGNVYRMVRGMQEYVVKVAPEVLQGVQLAMRGAEFLVHSFLFTTGGHKLARQMGIPDASIQTFPMFAPTKAFPNVAMPNIRPGWLSCFSHWFATQIFWYGGKCWLSPAEAQFTRRIS